MNTNLTQNETVFIKVTKFLIWVNIFFGLFISILGLYLIFGSSNNDNNENNNKLSDRIKIGVLIFIFGLIGIFINYFVLLKYINNDIVKVLVWLSLFSYLTTPKYFRNIDNGDNNQV